MKRERIIVHIRQQYPFIDRLPKFEHADVWTSACSNFGPIVYLAKVWMCLSSMSIKYQRELNRQWSRQCRCFNPTHFLSVQTSARSNFGQVSVLRKGSNIGSSNIGSRTLAAEVAKVSLFQVAEALTFAYDYKLPNENGNWFAHISTQER